MSKSKDLGTAYGMSKRKRYAKGGQIPPSAKTESRPMPDSKGQSEVSRNSGNKPAHEDSMTSRPDVKQSQRGPRTTPIKHPTMAQSPVFKVKMRDQEDHLESSAKTNGGPQEQPPESDNEMGADRQGPKVHKMKMMAKGGMINNEVSMHDAEEDEVEHPEGLESDNDQMGDEDAMDAHMTMLAEGGEAEMAMDHHDSIAAAIMARRDRLHAEIDSGAHDLDSAVKMAEGGEINGMDSIYSDDSDQADLSRNAEEDANMEDQSSYDALRKENYSESEGLDEIDNPSDSGQTRPKIDMDKHDMVDKIRTGMAKKRQFKAR